MLSTPVVLIIFRRAEPTRQVLEVLRDVRPSTLFVIADGPASGADTEACEETRRVIDEIDWDCRLIRDFSEENLGPRHRVVTGLDAVFRSVDRAIVLEDDCIPSATFFDFCEQLLDRYADDERVWEVGGCNFQQGRSRTDASYYFSRYVHTWGWATWKRCWDHLDPGIGSWPATKAEGSLRSAWSGPIEEAYWQSTFDRIVNGSITTSWDFQWMYAMWCQNATSIVPDVNLVTNIGFGTGASHHLDADHSFAFLPRQELHDLRHPRSFATNHAADAFEFRHVYKGRRHGGAALLKRLLKRS